MPHSEAVQELVAAAKVIIYQHRRQVMTFGQNSAGGVVIRMGRLSVWTDPCDKFWNPEIASDDYCFRMSLGWLNFTWRKIGGSNGE